MDAEKSMAYMAGWRDGYAAALHDLAERNTGFDPLTVEVEREEARNGP
jgi:hypothetical protein